MFAINRIIKLSWNVFKSNLARNISITSSVYIKQIDVISNGNEKIVRGVNIASPRETSLIKMDHGSETACPLCQTNINVKHTDVLILSQFLRSDGCMLPKRITGLCKQQQKRVSTLVTMAQKAGLMPNINPSHSKKDPKSRYGWKKYNKYFDESTIKWKY